MNMFVSQSTIADTELRHLAAVPYQQISPTNNSAIIGIFQDSLLGSYRFTRKDVVFTPRQAMNLLMSFTRVDLEKLKSAGKRITSFDLISQIMPPLSIKRNTGLFQDGENPKTSNNVLEIKVGEYLRGQLDKGSLGSTSKGILQRIFNDFGCIKCAEFVDDLQNIVTEYMKTSSFSVGISDLIANKKTNDEIVQVINTQKLGVQSIIDKVHLGIFENNTAYSNMNEFETMVNNTLNKATEESGKIGRKSLSKNNRFMMIVESGSKGSLINISQMLCCLGQQNVDGKRIPYGFDSRTLPHFTKYDDSPEARGFIQNSFISGLTAPELFFHAMAGRIGLIDTAVKSVTWETMVVVIDNGKPLHIEIGRWIDNKLDDSVSVDKIQKFKEKNMELLNVEGVYIPTTDENGVVTWAELTAVTRHDFGKAMYRVKTRSGREVVVPESKSLLVWEDDRRGFFEKPTPEIKIGEYMPVTVELTHDIQLTPGSQSSTLYDTMEDGIFIGLYLANGYIIDDNTIGILTENNIYFNKFITSYINKRCSIKFVGRSTVISTISSSTTSTAGSFLHSFIKENKTTFENKLVPEKAFVSNTGFMIGILNGYFSAKSDITSDSIVINSALFYNNFQLLEQISFLASRLGIFGEFSHPTSGTCNYTISAQWGQKFADTIDLFNKTKDVAIKTINWRLDYINYKTHNNVVLDEIVEITRISNTDAGQLVHPKLYDVTVPSTLNFQLANGLCVRDTSSTGYIQRRLIKGLEDLKVEYDMTVRNSQGKIIQFSYGDDGFDSTKIENQVIPLTGMSIEDIYSHYDIIGINEPEGGGVGVKTTKTAIFTTSTIARMKTQKEATLAKSKKYVEKMLDARNDIVRKVFKNKNDNMVKTGVAFQSLIANIHGMLGLNKHSAVDITPLETYELIEEYYEKLKRLTEYITPNSLFEILYYFYLTPRDLLVFKRFHRKGLILLLETILLKFKESIVHPGEMVGIISGQGCGAEMTQLTLNTFHSTGSATKSNVTRGVPRIEEILRLTKNPKNMSMMVYLKPIEETNQTKAMNYSNILEHMKLVDIVKSVQIYYDPNDNLTNVVEDRLFMEQYKEYEKMLDDTIRGGIGEESASGDKEKYTKSKWVIRIEMNAEMMLDKNVTMDDINFAIVNSEYNKDVQCVYTDYNSENLVFRIRVGNSVFSKITKRKVAKSLDQSDEIYLLKNFQDALLNNIVLRGINGVRNVLARKIQNTVILEEDKYVRKDTWVLDTTGSNLLETLSLDFIDYKRTTSNDIKEIFDVLGLEAARQAIYNELTEVFEFSDIYINYHHTSLLCDRMTCNKNMVAIFRFKSGLLNEDTGPISKSTFEVHTEILLNASRHGEFDNMRGVSANVMCGQYGNYGTSCFNLMLDKDAFENASFLNESTETGVVEGDVAEEIEKSFQLAEANTSKMDVCNKHSLTIQNNIVNIHTIGGMSGDMICDDNYNMGF